MTIPSSLIPGFSGGRSAVPPLAIPHPEDGQSLTMQYALSKLGTDYRLYPDSGVKAPSRPHSTSVLPGPDFGLTISAQDVPVTPTRRKNGPVRSSSTPSSPTATSTTGGTQCAGVTKAGKRCTRVVKSGVALLHVSPDAEVERFCHQHAKEILNPTGFYSHKTGDDWVEFKGLEIYIYSHFSRIDLQKKKKKKKKIGYPIICNQIHRLRSALRWKKYVQRLTCQDTSTHLKFEV